VQYPEGFVLPIAQGGTGASSIAAIKANLNLGNITDLDYAYDPTTKTLVFFEPSGS